MARSLCLVTLDSTSSSSSGGTGVRGPSTATGIKTSADVLLVGLGDGCLVGFEVSTPSPQTDGRWRWQVHSRKEVGLGTRGVHLVPFHDHDYSSPSPSSPTKEGGTCVLATRDRPTVVYLATSGGSPKLCFSHVNLDRRGDDEAAVVGFETLLVNVATPFYSSILFPAQGSAGPTGDPLCVADETTLRLGTIVRDGDFDREHGAQSYEPWCGRDETI